MSRLLHVDKETGAFQRFHYDHINDEFFIEQVSDVQSVLDDNDVIRQVQSPGWKGDGMHHVAQIPAVIVAKLMREGIWYDDEALLAWLDDRDNSLFKTKPGKLSK